ncbi:flavin-containing monooxygenase FMO GS-OX-like 3 [Hypomesus transpacificus]|uniref:flavin-containing monooxygenase FMO GS-OX-like 3 n=1 Tax=Hypomesus transpacificus TaxID=137520 RepID=UPI001F076180|nr:flavin-containing monooxygenase FMO GS-OX-like 3 [Hypomesus transpacificus]
MLRLRVAVVGAGAAGLCAARHILSRPDIYAPPVVYELSKNVGGTWFYEERVGNYDNGIPIHSSMYRNLRTNLPKEVMMFPDFPFDPQLPSFLPHKEVHRYLQSYCETHSITPHIKFATVVDDVSPVATETGESSAGTRWTVTSRDESGAETAEGFDSVFICNGHYSDPHFPSIPGMEHFKGTVMHSHSYRYPEPLSGKSVVVLGAGNSGVDICQELARANAKVILSHGKPTMPSLSSVGVEQAPPVVRVLEDGSFQFQDGSTTKAQALMLCTGYNFTYPFLNPTKLGLKIQEQLVTPLYKFMMPPAFPSLFILGICKIICPFPHFHCQVQYALGVLEGSVPLPSRADMEADAQKEIDRKAEMGVQLRHVLRMEKDQWGYYQSLAHTGKFSPPPPVTQSLFNEVVRQRKIHPHNYRRLNYRLVSATQWEQMETQTSL